MTDAAPARGRSSARGRGGYGSRGGRAGPRQANGTHQKVEEELEDQGEIGALKKLYAAELSTLKELFSDWTDVDLVFALQETNGDLPNTIERITEGALKKSCCIHPKFPYCFLFLFPPVEDAFVLTCCPTI